jgi:hypothetical protein
MPTTTTSTTKASRHQATMLVCLPSSTPVDQLASRAHAVMARHGHRSDSTVRHLHTRPGRLLRRLPFIAALRRWLRRGTAATARLTRTDIPGMRQHAYLTAVQRWLIWSEVTDGTRTARPLHYYRDQVAANPTEWTIDRAQREYRAQPRIRAMALYNADPDRVCDLPTGEIEIFQTGQAFYGQYHQLAAVPAGGVIDATGATPVAITRPGDVLDDLIDYLARANERLTQLPRRAHLVAVAY